MGNFEPRMDQIGAALADSSRARMLCELMSGRAYTNKELASLAGVEPQTATAHLQKLAAAGLVAVQRSGRCAYHCLASDQVAEALETLAQLSPSDHLYRAPAGSARTGDARILRSCYNHLAGRLAVRMADALIQQGVLVTRGTSFALGPAAAGLADRLGLVLPAAGRGSQASVVSVKACLDWSERRPHMAGAFGRAIMTRGLEAGWFSRCDTGRALRLEDKGAQVLEQVFTLPPTAWDDAPSKRVPSAA